MLHRSGFGRRALLGAAAIAPFVSVSALAEALSPAPRRNRLTQTIGSGLFTGTTSQFTFGAPPATFLLVVPIEAPCTAVRLGFGNPFDFPMQILSASIWPSADYGACAALQQANAAKPVNVVPSGSHTAVTFQGNGLDQPTVVTNGSRTGFTLPPNTANTTNVGAPFRIQWSDYVPVTSIPRPDGPALLFIYVAIGSAMTSVNPFGTYTGYNNDPSANRGRLRYIGMSWFAGDFTAAPGKTGFKVWGGSPVFAVQYATPRGGIQIATTGDSLSVTPLSTPVRRAAYDLSSTAAPVEVADLGWGGGNEALYGTLFDENEPAIDPSIVVYQAISRNDGSSAAAVERVLAHMNARAALDAQRGIRAVFATEGTEPSFDGNADALTGFSGIRQRLGQIQTRGEMGVVDGPGVIGQQAAPWQYQPGMSDDGTHLNSAGAERLVPAMKRALRLLIVG